MIFNYYGKKGNRIKCQWASGDLTDVQEFEMFLLYAPLVYAVIAVYKKVSFLEII